MDPDEKWTSTWAVLSAAAGQNRWPPAGSYMAATGQDLMAADTPSPGSPLPSHVRFQSAIAEAPKPTDCAAHPTIIGQPDSRPPPPC